jgi:hypothetical protein
MTVVTGSVARVTPSPGRRGGDFEPLRRGQAGDIVMHGCIAMQISYCNAT